MKRIVGALSALAMAALAWPASAQTLPEIEAILERTPGFPGVVGVIRDGEIVHLSGSGGMEAGGAWRWASVTKMVASILILRQVDAGTVDLDAPVDRYWTGAPNGDRITIRQLLRHRSGLANLDDGPDGGPGGSPDGMPDVYQGEGDWRTACLAAPLAEPDAGFAYNNCDYLILGEVLRAVTGRDFEQLVREEIAGPLGLTSLSMPADRRVEAQAEGAPEPPVMPAAYGPAGGLYGSMADLLWLDATLMAGELMSPESRAAMWDGDPAAGYAALGVWSYSWDLPGCSGPTRIVERRGAIGGVQVRNFLLPDLGMAMAVHAASDAVVFGELWEGSGLSLDLLAAVACEPV